MIGAMEVGSGRCVGGAAVLVGRDAAVGAGVFVGKGGGVSEGSTDVGSTVGRSCVVIGEGAIGFVGVGNCGTTLGT